MNYRALLTLPRRIIRQRLPFSRLSPVQRQLNNVHPFNSSSSRSIHIISPNRICPRAIVKRLDPIHKHFNAANQSNPSSTRYIHTSPPGQTLTLPDNRKLGYHTSGPPTGTPIIYIHGHPDSGITITGALESRVANSLNIHWIGPDRPGVGLSTRHESENTVLDYPADIAALADHLQLKEYYILGTSGGTGYTLACAKDLPREKLKGVAVCAGVGPVECGFDSMSEINRIALEAWRDHNAEFRKYIETEYLPLAQAASPDALAARTRADYEAFFTGADREAVLEEEAFNTGVAVYRQVWMQDAWANAKGMEVHWRPWGFRLQDVGFPGVRLWYGEKDVNATPVMGRYMAERLEGSVYKEMEGESHFTLWREETLKKMIGEWIGR